MKAVQYLAAAALMANEAAAQTAVYYNSNHQSFGIGSWNMNLINNWVSPGIVAGLFVFLFIILMFLFATCQLLGVQSPPHFTEKSIDWGKVEDVE